MRSPSVEFLEGSLGFNLNRVALLFRRELMRALETDAITPEQWQVLAALKEHPGGCTQAELGALTLKDKHALSRTLDRMERDGWIRRVPHPDDARAVRVTSGPRARALPRLTHTLVAHFADVRGVLTPAERRELLRLLAKLRAGLGDVAGPASARSTAGTEERK